MSFSDLPPELLSRIAGELHRHGRDAFGFADRRPPSGVLYDDIYWQLDTKAHLAALSRVSRDCHFAAQPFLYAEALLKLATESPSSHAPSPRFLLPGRAFATVEHIP